MGDAVHEMLNEIYRASGNLIEDELRLVDKELEISAYIDAMMEIDGKLWIVEYKSINSNGFNKLRGPKKEHLYQGITYLYVFNKLLKDGEYPEYEKYGKPEGIKFIYVNKNTSEMKEFDIIKDDETFLSIINKINIVKKHTEDKVLPEKTEDWCRSCPWRQKCQENYVQP